MPGNTHSQSSELCVTEDINVWVVKMCTGFVQIVIGYGCGFCILGKVAISSTGTQNFKVFQNDTK